jgi:periplasmic protein CpxP/Spy
MKRLTSTVVIAAVLGLGAYTFAGAQGPQGRGPGGPGGFGRGPGISAARLLRGLDLSEDQQAQLKALRESERGDRETPPAEFRLQRQLEAELFADAPNGATLESIQQQLLQAHAARLGKQIAAEQKIAQILTAEQRARVRERLEQAPAGQARGLPGDRRPGAR